jgi:hypothetical protein
MSEDASTSATASTSAPLNPNSLLNEDEKKAAVMEKMSVAKGKKDAGDECFKKGDTKGGEFVLWRLN